MTDTNNDKETFESELTKMLNNGHIKQYIYDKLKQLHDSEIKVREILVKKVLTKQFQVFLLNKENQLKEKDFYFNGQNDLLKDKIEELKEKDKEIERRDRIIFGYAKFCNDERIKKEELQAENERKTEIIKKYQENDE